MAKSKSEPQGVFSFFDDVEKTEPAPKARRNTLRPPSQVEEVEEKSEVKVEAEQAEVEETGIEVAERRLESEAEPTRAGAEVDKLQVDWEVEHSGNAKTNIESNKKEDADEIIEDENEKAREEALAKTVGEVENDNERAREAALEQKEEEKEFLPAKKSAGSRGRRSVKENSIAAEMIELPDDEELFKKQYYSMGEVTAMFNENHSLIRYWESEFDILKPRKNGKGDRFFRPIDVKNLYLIYDLLRRRKFTIEGAREYLKNDKSAEEKFAAVQSLQKIKGFFLELKANL